MRNKKFKLLLTFLFLILSCSIVSASSDVDGNLSADIDSVDDLSSNNLVENELAVDTPLNTENSSSSIRNSSLLLLMEVHLMITLPIW